MKEILIGRDKERRELLKWLDSERSEFIAIYGRRRVGKTFLVRKTVEQFAFSFSGSYEASLKDQLLNFGLALRTYFEVPDLQIPENWTLAFHSLRNLIEKKGKKKNVIFLDELPWIDTPKSGFLSALEYFWNSWASARDDIKLIICGSATSWIISKIIRAKGGLHNRVTHSILLEPFHLGACEEYFKAYGFRFSRMQIAECYMIMGGIPYYFSLMDNGESLTQNIDRLFFQENGQLRHEFQNLYRALFRNHQSYVSVIETLAQKGIGLTRQDILNKTGLSDNGEFSKMLEELELCGFIRSYQPYKTGLTNSTSKRTSRNTLYQLIDFYSLFYLKFNNQQTNFWESRYNSPIVNAWKGLTFEMLCQYHIGEIKIALGIGDVHTKTSSWRGEYGGARAQIDMVIDRNDDSINLCEMKYSTSEFSIDKRYAEILERKIEIFREDTDTSKNLLLTFITTKGIRASKYSYLAQREVSLADLFRTN